jgi:hypothetical protein
MGLTTRFAPFYECSVQYIDRNFRALLDYCWATNARDIISVCDCADTSPSSFSVA